jgi:hypothetical protein
MKKFIKLISYIPPKRTSMKKSSVCPLLATSDLSLILVILVIQSGIKEGRKQLDLPE